MDFAGREDYLLPFDLSSFAVLESAEFDSLTLCAFVDFHSRMVMGCPDVGN
jgi:hypothetical protein